MDNSQFQKIQLNRNLLNLYRRLIELTGEEFAITKLLKSRYNVVVTKDLSLEQTLELSKYIEELIQKESN